MCILGAMAVLLVVVIGIQLYCYVSAVRDKNIRH